MREVCMRAQAHLVLQLCFELTKLSLHALDGQVLVPELLGLSLEVSQLLQHSHVVGLQLCYPGRGLLQKATSVLRATGI